MKIEKIKVTCIKHTPMCCGKEVIELGISNSVKRGWGISYMCGICEQEKIYKHSYPQYVEVKK